MEEQNDIQKVPEPPQIPQNPQTPAAPPQSPAAPPQNPDVAPQKTAVAPQKTAVAPQKTAVAPQKTAVAPQKTAVAPQKTAMAPQKTAVAPQKTAVAPQKTAVAPQKTAVAPQKTAVAPDGLVASNVPQNTDGKYAQGDTVKAGNKSYTVEKLLGSGTEGDIYVVNDGSHRYALKLCHPGFTTNTAVMPALQKLTGKGYIADIIDYADNFELQKFFPEGSAAKADLRGNAQAITAIALMTAIALSEMHKVGIIHKDVKPANILIKDKANWNSVLCDFGIADVLNHRGTSVTPQVRTPIYAAPEVYAAGNTVFKEGTFFCELTPKADFYSLGMTILSLWMGEGAFQSKEAEMAIDKTKGRITVPADMPDPLAKICRGLLIKDPEKRWGLKEIELTLDNKDVQVDEDEIVEDLKITFNAAKHLIANTPMELADCMAEDPELGMKYLYRGQIERWLKPYPELVVQMQEIVEKRYPKDQEMGHYAAVCALNPALPFDLKGISRETGEEMEMQAVTFKDVSNFCNVAFPDESTQESIASDKFLEWIRARNAAIAENFPVPDDEKAVSDVFLLRVQMIDPLSDINLINDPNHPDFAMTGESIGRFLNKVYNIYWNVCGGRIDEVERIWNRKEYAPLNYQIPTTMVLNVAAAFINPDKYYYITSFFNTKGKRFKEQTKWFLYCTDNKTEDFLEKAGPKDDDFFAQASWMKVIKGFGATPEYQFVDTGKTVTTLKDVFRESKKTLKKELEERGLNGFLAVNRMEDPDANLKPMFAYEKLLREYLDDLENIDEKMEPVERFHYAEKEASKLLSEGKTAIRSLIARSVAQRVLTIVFAIVPAALLLLMLLFSIIEHPTVDTESLHLGRYVWVIGLIIAAIMFFKQDDDFGCLPSLIAGGIIAFVLVLLVQFLGQFILYIYAVIVLGVLGFFCWKTVFNRSTYAAEARKFTKPGFDEKVLEPLYYAFGEEEEFDSSLNGAFNEDEIENWKADLKARRIFMLLFIGSVWFLLLFAMLIPQSERFSRITAPFTEVIQKFVPASKTSEPYLVQPLQKGDKGEEVQKLQQFLIDQGFTKNKPDGDFGPGTKKVVEIFQKANGLEVTGMVDEKTIETINKIVAEMPKDDGASVGIEGEQAAKSVTGAKPAAAKKVSPTQQKPNTKAASQDPEPSNVPTVTLDQLKKREKEKSAEPEPSDAPTVTLDQLKKMAKDRNNAEATE